MADSLVTSIEDINKMKVADLKRELKNRGLNTVGNKNELAERLATALETDSNKMHDLSSEELIDDVLNDDDDDLDDEIEEDVEAAEESLHLDTIVEPELTLKRKISEPEIPKVAPKKIVLNRALSIPSTTPVETKVEEKIVEAKSNKVEITNVKSTDEKRVIKLSNLTVKERMEMRAKKFGAPISTDLAKEARSARFGIPAATTEVKTQSIGTAPVKLDLLKKRAERFGTSVSPVMSNLDVQERLERRKARFGTVDTTLKKGTTVK